MAVVPGYYLVCYNKAVSKTRPTSAVVPGYYLVCYNRNGNTALTSPAVVPGYYLVCYNEIGYFIVQDLETTVDIVNGEIIEVGDLDTENIKNIGSMVDYSDFVEGIRYHADNGLDIPYIPCLNAQVTALPYFKLKCLKCGQISLSCSYMAKHKGCGGYYTIDFATKIYRERTKEKELA